jgi:hypothetical protein
MYYSKKEYDLLKFQKSTSKNKKYDAILQNKLTKKIVKIPFGDKRYQQFYDKIGLYSSLNHNDKERRCLYIARHSKDINLPYSPSYFSLNYLW